MARNELLKVGKRNTRKRVAEIGFRQGSASACLFQQKSRGIVISVHGDDFTASGTKTRLDWWQAEMEKRYELTVGGRLGPAPEDSKEVRCFNRVIRWTARGIEYEADPRLASALLSKWVSRARMAQRLREPRSARTRSIWKLTSLRASGRDFEAQRHWPSSYRRIVQISPTLLKRCAASCRVRPTWLRTR